MTKTKRKHTHGGEGAAKNHKHHGMRKGKSPKNKRAGANGKPQQKGLLMEGFFMAARAGYGFVRTGKQDWPDIFIPASGVGEARHSDQVLIRVNTRLSERQINKESRIEGQVLKVLHHMDEADLCDNTGNDMKTVMLQYGMPEDFPAEVLAEAAAVPQTVSAAEMEGRRDCRNMPLVTIDGKDSRDFDDAVYCTRLENGNYFLSVQIADVAHYVKVGSALEEEAFARATSVYLPDRVIPMLPFALSNGICSLNAGEDRLAMACDMEYTPRGRLVDYDIYQSVIRVAKRLDYDTVNAILLDKDKQLIAENREWLPLLKPLAALQRILEKKRARRGALNFDFPEIKVKIGENGEVVEIGKRYSRLAEKMIEQAMLAANETVAEHYKKLQMPFVYRVHEGPGDEKLLNLNSALLAFDYPELGGEDGEVSPKEMQKLLALTEGRPEAELIQIMALRSMSHAAYSPDCTGHFGLAAKYYCHFTSPIRRYADLAVHRIIKRELNSNDDTAPRRLTRYVAAAAKQASDREKLAEEVEREAVKMKECLYMREHIGEEFAAKVSGMTAGGIYVALENGIEGRISVDDLPQDEYNYIAETMLMHGRKHSYTLGDELNVRLARVSMMERHMDFVLAE